MALAASQVSCPSSWIRRRNQIVAGNSGRNADCHAKNLALLYTSRADVHLSPAYDSLTTSVYAGYQFNPPGIGFLGKKTWTPGKNLMRFISGTFGISAREQSIIWESISDAVLEGAPLVREKMKEHPGFRDIGKRILVTWREGVEGLRDSRVYAAGGWSGGTAFEGISESPKLENSPAVIGRSLLLGRRSKR